MAMFEYDLTFDALHASTLSFWPDPQFIFYSDRPAVVEHCHSAQILGSHQVCESKVALQSRAHTEYIDIRHHKYMAVMVERVQENYLYMYGCFLEILSECNIFL